MSGELYICTTVAIAWEDFYEFLLEAGRPLGLEETSFYCDELHLPFQSGIGMGIHYKFSKVYVAAMLTVEPKTLRLLTKI